MDAQLTFTLNPTSRIESAFRQFHRRNPEVYAALVHFAREALARGKAKLGIGALWERARWELWLKTDDTFKLNNNYRSRYARLLMQQESDLRGVFEVRELRS